MVEDSFAVGHEVRVRVTWSGTYTGEFLGHAPTGRSATWDASDFDTVASTSLASPVVGSSSIGGQLDRLGLLEQLWLLPTPQ
jgi:hypothetical protein